jgi:hypothetical protein
MTDHAFNSPRRDLPDRIAGGPIGPAGDLDLSPELRTLDAALARWGAASGTEVAGIADRVFEASRTHLRQTAPTSAGRAAVRSGSAWQEAWRSWLAPARLALAASLVGALLLAVVWTERSAVDGMAGSSGPNGLVALLDEPPISEPILLAMLGGSSSGVIEWPIAEWDDAGAGSELLSLLRTRSAGFDDYASEIEFIVGDAVSAPLGRWGL